ncbi:MAG: hypothetical protein STSR0003_15430 [Smithella sp.]
MIKYLRKFYFLIILILLVACTPQKYLIKYDVDKTDKKISNISDSKIGILLFEDNRPSIERTGKISGFSDTFITKDELLFEQPIPVMVAEAIQRHLKSRWNSNVSVLDKKSNEINIEYLENQKNEKYDYILIGSIAHFTQMKFDEHYTARMAGAAISGLLWPLAPILFPISVAVGEVQKTTEIDFNKLYLIKIDGPQIIWQGQCKTSSTENVAVTDGTESSLKFYTENLKKAITCISETVSLSAEMDFPNKLSVDQTKKLINHLTRSQSLNNLNY